MRHALALFLALAAPAGAQLDPPAWTHPIPPVHLVGPVDYVGTEGLAAYLIRTPAGAILLDGTLKENVPAIERNIAAQGVALSDVRLLLNSHAHFDHAAGLARLRADTGAPLAAGIGDRAALEAGIPPGETSYGVVRFPPVKVARAVRDGERVAVGGVTLTTIATPGHTPGDTSWLLHTTDHGRSLDVLFLGSLTVAGNRLVGNGRYPGIVADFRRSFARLARVRADVVLTEHPETADVLGGRKPGRWSRPSCCRGWSLKGGRRSRPSWRRWRWIRFAADPIRFGASAACGGNLRFRRGLPRESCAPARSARR